MLEVSFKQTRNKMEIFNSEDVLPKNASNSPAHRVLQSTPRSF